LLGHCLIRNSLARPTFLHRGFVEGLKTYRLSAVLFHESGYPVVVALAFACLFVLSKSSLPRSFAAFFSAILTLFSSFLSRLCLLHAPNSLTPSRLGPSF